MLPSFHHAFLLSSLSLFSLVGSIVAAPLQAERVEVTSSLQIGSRPRVTPHTMIFARMQPYDLYGNYLDNWIDRPLYHNRAWRDVDPAVAFCRDAAAVLEYEIEGFTILGNAYATRYQDALAMLQRGGVSPAKFRFMAGIGGWSSPWERHLNNAKWAEESPYTLRINGKIPFFPYLGTTAEVLGDLRRQMQEAGFNDQLYFTSAWLGLFATFNQNKGQLPEAKIEEAKQSLREKLSYADGISLLTYHMHRNPVGDYMLLRRFYPELDQKYVAKLVEEVYREPIGQGKLLGIDVRHGYVGHMSGVNEAELGTSQLRDALDSALLYNPDIISLVEWNEANENTSFQPTVCNSRSIQRLIRFYARKLQNLPTAHNPGDDLTLPNLIVSVRRTVKLGEKYRLEILNVPDTDEEVDYTVQLSLLDEKGNELYRAPAVDTFRQSQLTAITYTLPSENWPTVRAVIPQLEINFRGYQHLISNLRHTRLETSQAWDYKEIRMPLRDMLEPLQAELKVSPAADGTMALSGQLRSATPLTSVEILDHDLEHWAYDRNNIYDAKSLDTVVLTVARRETVLMPAEITVSGADDFVWQPWGRPYSSFGQLTKSGNRLHGELNVWAVGAMVIIGIPKQSLDSELTVELGEYGNFSMPLAKLRQLRCFATELPQQTILRLELRTRLPDHPAPANEQNLTWQATMTPTQGASFLHLRAIDAQGRIYRSQPWLTDIDNEDGANEPLNVFSATSGQVMAIQVATNRITDINYLFTPEHGGVLLNPGAPAWNAELGSGFRYIYPAWRNAPNAEAKQVCPAWRQVGQEWVLDFDGVGNYLVLPMDAFPTGAFTLRFTCRTDSTENMALFNHAGNKISSLRLHVENGQLSATFGHMGRNLQNPSINIATGLDFPRGQWNDVVVTYDLKNIRLQVNEQTYTKELNLRAAKPGTAWFGGVRNDDILKKDKQLKFFQGQLKELRIRHNAQL